MNHKKPDCDALKVFEAILAAAPGWIGQGKTRDRWVGVIAGPGQMYHWKRAGADEPRPKA